VGGASGEALEGLLLRLGRCAGRDEEDREAEACVEVEGVDRERPPVAGDGGFRLARAKLRVAELAVEGGRLGVVLQRGEADLDGRGGVVFLDERVRVVEDGLGVSGVALDDGLEELESLIAAPGAFFEGPSRTMLPDEEGTETRSASRP
jgi:hypothetical protein